MATYAANWILSLSMLVSCIIIGSVAGNEEANKALKLNLKRDDLEPEAALEMLLNHKDDFIFIDSYSVKQLIQLCEESVEKCSEDQFISVERARWNYEQTGYAAMFKYIDYCLTVKLKTYCIDHIDQVGETLLKRVDPEDQRLVGSLMEYFYDETILGIVEKEDTEDGFNRRWIGKAYFKLLRSEHRHKLDSMTDGNEFLSKVVNTEDEQEFRDKLMSALEHFANIAHFFESKLGSPSLESDTLIARWKIINHIYVQFVNVLCYHINFKMTAGLID